MEKFYMCVVRHRKAIAVLFSLCFILCLFLRSFVSVNYDINDYLPSDAKSTVALDVMEDEFGGGIPNARVMIKDITIPQALEYKEKIKAIQGVTDVVWLDDSADILLPLSAIDTDILESYYKDNAALFSVTIDEDYRIEAVDGIRELIGDENAMTGSAVSTAFATVNTVSEIQKITVIAVLFVLLVLLLTTTSWAEPFVVLIGLGVAIVINNGSNLIFGEISFVTNAAGSVLQLAVSLDYSVFLIHRFAECRRDMLAESASPVASSDEVSFDADISEKAMIQALCKSTTSILSSGLTTVIGFLALILMQFQIGPDLGIALAKGVAISLLTVFLFMPSLILVTYKQIERTQHRSFMPSFRKFGVFITKIAVPMICIFVILILPSYLASNSNYYHYGSSRIYEEGTVYGRDKVAIENVFGKSDTYVLLVPKGDEADEIKLSEDLHALSEVSDIISYTDTVGAEIPPEYLEDDTLSLLKSDNYSRFVITLDADYEGEATFSLVESIRGIAEKYYPNQTHLAGEGVSTYDLMDTITADMVKVNLLAIAAVFLVLLLTMKSLCVPIILVLCIETAVWLNLSVPYFSGSSVYYIAYLIISSVQLGATVDYAILMTDRYKESRLSLDKRAAAVQTVSDVSVSILTSGSVLTVVGLLLGYISTNKLLAQLGIFVGRGAVFSLAIVLFVLPGLLITFDSFVVKDKSQNSQALRETKIEKGRRTSNKMKSIYENENGNEKEEMLI